MESGGKRHFAATYGFRSSGFRQDVPKLRAPQPLWGRGCACSLAVAGFGVYLRFMGSYKWGISPSMRVIITVTLLITPLIPA